MLRKRVSELEENVRQLTCSHIVKCYEIRSDCQQSSLLWITSKCDLCGKETRQLKTRSDIAKKALEKIGIKL